MKAAALWSILLAADAGTPAPVTPSAPAPNKAIVAKQWQAQRKPSAGPALSIGTTSRGCLQGAATLPASGPGYEVKCLARNRRFGHPNLIAYVRRLGAGARKAKLKLIVVGDLSQPRGGPTPSGHRSHQTGLDADIGYAPPAGVRAGHLSRRAREQLSPLAVIDVKTHETTRAWTPGVVKLLALAAADPAVDRIFVNPAIKKLLCEGRATAKAPWQARLRPWWAHHDHFHVRLKCPADSPLCVPQETPRDDGCGATLAWWFGDRAAEARTKKKEAEAAAPEPALPASCEVLVQTKRKLPDRAPPSPRPSTHAAASRGEGDNTLAAPAPAK